jgi:hypothetical protein
VYALHSCCPPSLGCRSNPARPSPTHGLSPSRWASEETSDWHGMMSEEMRGWHGVMHCHVQRCWAKARGGGGRVRVRSTPGLSASLARAGQWQQRLPLSPIPHMNTPVTVTHHPNHDTTCSALLHACNSCLTRALSNLCTHRLALSAVTCPL